MGVPHMLGGSSSGWLKSAWLSARPKCQQVQSMNLNVDCLETYLGIYIPVMA